VRLRESIEVARPPDHVYATLAEPERRGDDGAWREIGRDDGAYRAKLHLPGSIDLDFDCRFDLEEQPPHAVSLAGLGQRRVREQARRLIAEFVAR
jgi:carbon monoxide dehydrogenase subunit G